MGNQTATEHFLDVQTTIERTYLGKPVPTDPHGITLWIFANSRTKGLDGVANQSRLAKDVVDKKLARAAYMHINNGAEINVVLKHYPCTMSAYKKEADRAATREARTVMIEKLVSSASALLKHSEQSRKGEWKAQLATVKEAMAALDALVQ